MPSVICIGIAVLDYVYAVDAIPNLPDKHRANGLAIVGGGIAANGAVAVARLGGQAELITRLGLDATAREILGELARAGVRTGRSRRFPGLHSPVSAIFVDPAGERLVMNYSDPHMPSGTGWLPQRLTKNTGAVLGDTRWEEGSWHMFALARAAGIPAVLDADRAPKLPGLIEAATHAVFSARGLRELAGIDDLAAALLSLDTPDTQLGVTDGARGVLWRDGRDIRCHPSFPVTVVDTLAAGDTWHGAFALGLAEGMGDAAATRFASAAAALKCTRFGGRAGIPTRAEVQDFLKGCAS